MPKLIVSLAALFTGLALVGLSYAWPRLQTNWTNENQQVLAQRAAQWHGATYARSEDSKESPLARAARIEEYKQLYLVQKDALLAAQAAIARTSRLLYYAGIALGIAGVVSLSWKNKSAA